MSISKLSADLPDNVPLQDLDLPTRIQRVLAFYGLRTVGELRQTTDAMLLTFQDLGPRSVAYIRASLHSEQGQ